MPILKVLTVKTKKLFGINIFAKCNCYGKKYEAQPLNYLEIFNVLYFSIKKKINT
jgi:hypothetical protein